MTAPALGSNPPMNGPFLPTAVYPTLPLQGLAEDEASTANTLAMRLFNHKPYLELRGLYYDGLQKMQDLGISIPPSLSGLRTVMGWPQIGVDALDERCIIDGFRYPDSTDADADLMDMWQGNHMPIESSLAHLDAFIYGRSYVIVGPGDDPEMPLITVESPLNMTAVWDARLRKVTSALQVYLNTDFTSDLFGREVAALYLPGRTIHMARESANGGVYGKWEIVTRDNHGFPDPPVVRIANRQRVSARDGASEITPAWMNIVDAGCRDLLGMEVGREFHAAPRRYILGASEENFRRPDGTPMSAWETYIGKVWGIERDENGDLPQVGQFNPSDPSVYTKLYDTHARSMATAMAVPLDYLGITAEANPASADAIRATEARLVKRAERKMLGFSHSWQEVLKFALAIRDGSEPDNTHRILCDWADAATPTPGATTDALVKQIQAGMVTPTSDVVLKRAGYSALERARLEQDRKNDAGSQFLAQLADSLQAKAARTDMSVIRDINPTAAKVTSVEPAANPGAVPGA